MLIALIVDVAAAGSGPWVPGSGRANLYVGLDAQYFTRLATNGEGRDVVDVGEGVSTFGGVLDLSYGVARRAEVELIVPIQHAHANRPDSQICVDLGLDACKGTTTLGVIEARGKGLIADQVAGAPVSLALGGIVRYGGATAATRERITNAGEGTVDFGPLISVGRGGGLGQGYYSLSLDGAWVYRLPNTDSYPNLVGDGVAPNSEFLGSAEALFSPRRVVSIGPAATASGRPGGLDFTELDLTDRDRFAALRYVQIRAGGKLVVRDGLDNAFVLSVFRTVYAANNPADVLTVSAGVSFYGLGTRRRATAPAGTPG